MQIHFLSKFTYKLNKGEAPRNRPRITHIINVVTHVLPSINTACNP